MIDERVLMSRNILRTWRSSMDWNGGKEFLRVRGQANSLGNILG